MEIELEVAAGENISAACRKAVEKATLEQSSVWFSFNGVKITVDGNTDPGDAVETYMFAAGRRPRHTSAVTTVTVPEDEEI